MLSVLSTKSVLFNVLQNNILCFQVPFLSGKALFTHDMGTDVMTIHDFVAEPAGGGRIRGAGQLWVAPVAEHDPKAVHIRCEGHGVAAHELMQRYVPQTVEVPKILDCGATHFKMMMKGSHASPITNIQFEAPSTLVTGDVTLSRSEWKATATAPAFDLSGTLYTQFPEFERTKQIYTQTEMSRVCQPKIQGVDSVVTLKGCDMLPLFSNKPSPSRIQSGQALRLKVSGTTQIKAWHIPTEHRDGQPRHFQGDVMLQVHHDQKTKRQSDIFAGTEIESIELGKEFDRKARCFTFGCIVKCKRNTRRRTSQFRNQSGRKR